MVLKSSKTLPSVTSSMYDRLEICSVCREKLQTAKLRKDWTNVLADMNKKISHILFP